MSALRWLSALCLGVAIASGAAWWLQRQAAAELRTEIALAREDGRELARLQAENRRLAGSLPSDAELDRMRADHAAIADLRAELERTRQNLQAREHALAAPAPAAAANRTTGAAGGAEEKVRLPPLTNAGRATPAAAVETVFWTASQRNVDALASMLTLEPAARPDAERLLASLPPEQRSQFQTLEQLLARSLLAVPKPTGIRVVEETSRDADHVDLRVEMQSAAGATARPVPFSLQRAADGWQLVVPRGAVGSLAKALAGQAPASP